MSKDNHDPLINAIEHVTNGGYDDDPLTNAITLATASLQSARNEINKKTRALRLQNALLAFVVVLASVLSVVVYINAQTIEQEAQTREHLICDGFTAFAVELLGEDPSPEGLAAAERLFNQSMAPGYTYVDCSWPPDQRVEESDGSDSH